MNLDCGSDKYSPLSELSPIKSLRLKTLNARNTQVADLSPLREMSLGKGRHDALHDLPDLDWDVFERASELARRDLAGSS